jgi:hypothetical protein
MKILKQQRQEVGTSSDDINEDIQYKKLRKKIFAERDEWRDRIVKNAIRTAFDMAVEAGDIDENTPREESLKIQAGYIRRNLEASRRAREVREKKEAEEQKRALEQHKITMTAINGRRADLQARKAQKDLLEGLEGKKLYQAEWEKSPELAAKFQKLEYYEAFRAAADLGLVNRVVTKKEGNRLKAKSVDSAKSTEEVVKDPLKGLEGKELFEAEYQHDPKLKEIYGSPEVYTAFKAAEVQGRIRIARKKTKKYVMGSDGEMTVA